MSAEPHWGALAAATGFVVFAVVVLLPLEVSQLRMLYHKLFLRKARWIDVAERYAYAGPEPEAVATSIFPRHLLEMPSSTLAGFDADGLFIQIYGPYRDLRPIKVPWQHLRVDFDTGVFVVLEIVPERICFTFTRWFVGGENLRRIKTGAT